MITLKKLIAISFIALSLLSCGDSMESDARKTARNSYCAQLHYRGEIEMSEKEQREIIEWGNKMLQKYGNGRTEKGRKFSKMVDSELEKIKKSKH